MRADKKTYEAVAEKCDSFSEKHKSSTTNSTSNSDNVSCTNCRHFTDNSYCELNLYDQIIADNNIK